MVGHKELNPLSLVSFGAGKRNCIGQHLARIEYKIVLSGLSKNFRVAKED